MIDRPRLPPSTPEAFAAAKADAKRLMRLARTGALATFDGETRAPLATLVGVASDLDGAPLFLMSELARHTRNLADDARASLLVTTAGGRGDPLNQPRLTLGGPIARHADPVAKARYLQRNPKAKLYADFTDFAVRRMHIETVHFNGGFGRADALAPADLTTPIKGAETLVAAEAELLAEVEALDNEVLARLTGVRRVWRPIGLDPDGLDLGGGGGAQRVMFPAPALTPGAWRRALRERIEAANPAPEGGEG